MFIKLEFCITSAVELCYMSLKGLNRHKKLAFAQHPEEVQPQAVLTFHIVLAPVN